jgi:hypothetical protein
MFVGEFAKTCGSPIAPFRPALCLGGPIAIVRCISLPEDVKIFNMTSRLASLRFPETEARVEGMKDCVALTPTRCRIACFCQQCRQVFLDSACWNLITTK